MKTLIAAGILALTAGIAEARPWTYETGGDELRRTVRNIAYVRDTKGRGYELVVGEQGKGRHGVFLMPPNGEILWCMGSHRFSYVSLRFDDRVVEDVACNDNGRGGRAIMLTEARSLSELQRSTRLIVEARSGLSGTIQIAFEFDPIDMTMLPANGLAAPKSEVASTE